MGSLNRRTKELEAKAAEAAQIVGAAIPGAFEGDAHALLMTIYKDPAQPMELRLDAAKAAIRFEKPVLAAIDMTSVNEHSIYYISDEPMSDEDWEREYCAPKNADSETEH